MKIADFNPSYGISNPECNKDAADYRLTWKFMEGSHFMVCVHSKNDHIPLEEIKRRVEAEGYTDENLVMGQNPVIENRDDNFLLYTVAEGTFFKQNRSYKLRSGNLQKGVLYQMDIYACEYDEDKQILTVYDSKKDQNVCYTKAKVVVSKKIKNSLFDNYAICEIKVQPSEGFEDGSVVYTIDGVNGEFPLTEKCQGRTVYVRLPKHAQLHIKAADEYSKMITVKVSE